MTVYNKACGLLLVVAIMLLSSGCGTKEPEVKEIVGIQYDDTSATESTEEATEETTENTESTEVVEKKGVNGNGLAGLEDLQKEFVSALAEIIHNEQSTDNK